MIQKELIVSGHNLYVGSYSSFAEKLALPTGSADVDAFHVTFEGGDWDGLVKSVQFQAGDEMPISVSVNESGIAVIPSQILSYRGVVHVNIHGVNILTSACISTYAVDMIIGRGGWTSANAPSPSPSMFEQAVVAGVAAVIEQQQSASAQAANTAAETANTAAEVANAAAERANTAARITTSNLAQAFDADASYAIGQYVAYQGRFYRCIAAHSGAWDDDDFSVVTVGHELELLKSAVLGDVWDSASDIKRLVTLGMHHLIPVGEQFEASWQDEETVLFDVADRDVNCASNEQSIMLISHDILTYGTIPFSAPQLLIYAITALPAGNYRFTLDHADYGGGTNQNGTYIFSIRTEVPAGGGIRHSTVGVNQSGGYTKKQITGGKISTYGVQPQRTAIETNIAVYEWDGSEAATDLGTISARNAQYAAAVSGVTKVNYSERNAYGSNRYAHSCLRKWLNSAGKTVASGDTTFSYWWTPSDDFDMPPSEAARKMAGFLHGLDPDLADNIGEATIVVEMPSPERTAGADNTETLHDKVFCLSMTEVYGGTNISVKEGKQLTIYAGTGNSAKIKYQGSAAQSWILRSARPSLASYVRYVRFSGELSYNDASHSYGVVCGLIIKAPKA